MIIDKTALAIMLGFLAVIYYGAGVGGVVLFSIAMILLKS